MPKHPGGRPLKYKTLQELQERIDEYFAYCDNRMKQIYPKEGEAYGIANPEPYTMAGLAYYLGIDRKTLINYSNKDEFFHAVKEARNKVEFDVERRMVDKETFTPGLIFNAKNNFGWKDVKQEEHSGRDGQPIEQNIVYMPKPIEDNDT